MRNTSSVEGVFAGVFFARWPAALKFMEYQLSGCATFCIAEKSPIKRNFFEYAHQRKDDSFETR